MRLAVGLSFVALVCLAGLPAAQQPSQPQPTFRAGIDVVELDVSVLDKNRQPIHGLTAEDFTIRENSKPQPIVAFKPVDIPEDPPAPETPWLRDVAPDVRRNDEFKDPRVFVIVIDDAMAVPEAWILASTRKIARQVIEKLGPSDLAAVTFTSAGADSQELTSDHARLLAAVDRFNVGFHDVMPTRGFEVAEEPHFLAPLRTLQAVAEALIAAPQSRKAIVYISSGVPVDYSEAAVRSLGAFSSSVRGTSGATTASTTTIREMQIRLIDDMKEVFTQARLANINVYCIDSGGLDGLDSYLARKRVEARMTANQWVPTYEDGNRYREFSQTMAANTGGLAVINTNDFAPGIAQMFKENGSYYAIGYQSTDTRRDGSYRRIEVKVNRPGAIIRAKSGYYADKTLTGNKALAATAAEAQPAASLAGALPKGGVPLQVAVATFASSNPKSGVVAITLGVRSAADAHAEDGGMDLVFSAFTTQQKLQATQSLHVKAAPAGMAQTSIAYDVVTRLDLPPGRYTLRVAARRASGGKSGSVYTDVDVPDFTQQVVALSGVVLNAIPGPPNPAPGRLEDIVPVVPTSLREFASSDRVTAFFRVYERGKTGLTPGQLAIRILDQHGAAVLDDPRPIAPDRFDATGTAEYSLALPTHRLPAGQYLLTIEAVVGKSSFRHDVRFQLR